MSREANQNKKARRTTQTLAKTCHSKPKKGDIPLDEVEIETCMALAELYDQGFPTIPQRHEEEGSRDSST